MVSQLPGKCCYEELIKCRCGELIKMQISIYFEAFYVSVCALLTAGGNAFCHGFTVQSKFCNENDSYSGP